MQWTVAEKFEACVDVSPALLWVLNRRPLVLSAMSVMSLCYDDKDDEMILGAVHRSNTYLTAKENLS